MQRDPNNPEQWQLTPVEQAASGEPEFVLVSDFFFGIRLGRKMNGLAHEVANTGDFHGARRMAQMAQNHRSMEVLRAMQVQVAEDASLAADVNTGIADIESFLRSIDPPTDSPQ